MTNFEYNQRYDAAVADESRCRSLAFLHDAESICGIPVRPLTLELLERLKIARSPFILGGTADHYAMLHFLWLVCAEFSTAEDKRAEWIQRQQGLDVESAILGIDEYVERAFMDARSSGKSSRPMVAMSATMALEMAGDPFRMDWRDVMKTPLAVLFQLVKAKDISEGTSRMNKRSDKITGDWLAELNKQNKEKANGG